MTINVEGMSCNHCKMTIEKALKDAGYAMVDVDLEAGTVSVDAEDFDHVKGIIESNGYNVNQ